METGTGGSEGTSVTKTSLGDGPVAKRVNEREDVTVLCSPK